MNEDIDIDDDSDDEPEAAGEGEGQELQCVQIRGVDSDDDSDGETAGGGEDLGLPRRPIRIRRKDRAVHSLDSALDIDNYDQYHHPQVREEHTAVLEKTPGRQPNITITWENQPRVRVGRRARENILAVEGGVIGEAMFAETPAECFSLFFSDQVFGLLVELTY